jgi:hypothetical protein
VAAIQKRKKLKVSPRTLYQRNDRRKSNDEGSAGPITEFRINENAALAQAYIVRGCPRGHERTMAKDFLGHVSHLSDLAKNF